MKPFFDLLPMTAVPRPAHGGLFLPQNGEKSGTLWKIVLYWNKCTPRSRARAREDEKICFAER